ncbi:serine/threonine-protein kinase D2-like [Triplophysa rosa]|uniref:serine/threonine-protein kinase D2-like n=1 Tax=Triplophysa rosa TaxID=992332 RepID=UPI0025460604|nr:serine/threonine-protein kinase D2-like [Triplophysa rosa]
MDKIKSYDELRKQLENDELTQKGFDARVKHLLCGEEAHSGGSLGTLETKEKNEKAYMDAAQVFTKAKQLIKPQVKKCQFPLRQKEKTLLKIKMSPMEWKPRTSKKPGRYQKVILEEAPPRIIVAGTEDYDELIRIAQEAFWTEKEREGSTFTLCHSDGTRWTKEQFNQEYGSVSEIPTPWKRTFYIGRREMDIICLGESSSALGNDEMEDSDMDFQPKGSRCVGRSSQPSVERYMVEVQLQGESLSLGKSSRRNASADASPDPHSERSLNGGTGTSTNSDPGAARSTSADSDQGARETSVPEIQIATPNPEKPMKEGVCPQNEVFYVSSNVVTILPSLYSPRLPLVDKSLISYSEQNLLGEGTFGKVYLGSFQGTPAAIKRIPYGIAGLQDQDIQHEILVSMRLSHPNIVRLMAAAHTENTFLLANEYIHGTTLDNVLHSDNACVKLEGNDSHFVALDISMAVEYIHSKNVIHQDLKPDNILLVKLNLTVT